MGVSEQDWLDEEKGARRWFPDWLQMLDGRKGKDAERNQVKEGVGGTRVIR